MLFLEARVSVPRLPEVEIVNFSSGLHGNVADVKGAVGL